MYLTVCTSRPCPPSPRCPPQYEHLTAEENQAAELWRVKTFLGLDPRKGGDALGLYNHRKDKIQVEGWPMQREDYEALVDMVRPDGVA